MADRVRSQSSLEDELHNLQSKYSDALTKEQALNYAIESAELHMKFLRLATSKLEKQELGSKCKSLLDEAERIKSAESWNPSQSLLGNLAIIEPNKSVSTHGPRSGQYQSNSTQYSARKQDDQPFDQGFSSKTSEPVSTRALSSTEKTVLSKSANINGVVFPPFRDSQSIAAFSKAQGKDQYKDPAELKLSSTQLAILDDWKRPSAALPPPLWPSTATSDTAADPDDPEPYMKASQVVDLVQDAATDCSIIASLSAGIARTEHGFSEILSTAIYPFDVAAGHPYVSPIGKYIVRLNFNGTYRQVIIDDRLPVSKTSRVLHVVDRNNPRLLWPALLEKAYLKVRGGYDFPGSNSGTDLWVLTGWIPEQIFLQSSEMDVEKLWSRVFKAFSYGDVLITLGTGVMTASSERDLGLAGEHDYAVIELDESNDRKRVLIKNPWLQATAWKDYHIAPENIQDRMRESSLHDVEVLSDAPVNESAGEGAADIQSSRKRVSRQLSPGMFWMDVNNVMQNFESMYLNWNPTLFKLRQDIHFEWDLRTGEGSGRSCSASVISNPQFSIVCGRSENIWLLLSKHFKDEDSENAAKGTQGYISLYAFENNGTRAFLSRGAIKQTPYVDSPQTLLTIEAAPQMSYTIAVSEQDLQASIHTFTLSVFSRAPVTLDIAPPKYPEQSLVRSSWKHANAGGNASSPLYSHNPQFSLTLTAHSSLCIILETTTPGLSVHAKLLHGQGQRVFSVTNRDIILDTGDYRRGCALAESKGAIPAGTYTIICSTFEAGQLGEFNLRVTSDVKSKLVAIAKEGAGRIRERLADASFGFGIRAIASPVVPKRLASVNFTARYIPSLISSSAQTRRHPSDVPAHSPIRLTIELGRGPSREIVIASGQGSFRDDPSGVRTEDVSLRPEMTQRQDMWLVLERLGIFDTVSSPEERVSVELFSDVADAADFGVWRDWQQ